MKYILTINADVPPQSGVLLLELAMSFCNRRLRPATFTWTTLDETSDVRVRIELEAEEETLRGLVAECRGLAGVRDIWLNQPGNTPVGVRRSGREPQAEGGVLP